MSCSVGAETPPGKNRSVLTPESVHVYCFISRSIPVFRFPAGIRYPLALMALLLAIDPAGLDFAIARAFYVTGSGFIGRHSFWLEDILHDRAKQVVIALGVVAIALS
jgi:membrane-associated PAP2 superfamily phosphatase